MKHIKKEIAQWEVRYGQINLSGNDNIIAREIFNEYFGQNFKMKTFLGDYNGVHFNEKSSPTSVRLSCSKFFTKLKEGDIIYIQPIEHEGIEILNIVPQENKSEIKDIYIDTQKKYSDTELLNIIAELVNENKALRDLNSSLFVYKDRIEKYQSLQRIFNDERFMEDWLERNIHKAIPDLEVIERQPTVSWPKSGLRNRFDFFCMDKTTKEFVIVENKIRGNTSKIDTQCMTYTTWVNKNLNELNMKYKEKGLNATNNFKFVIITDAKDDRLEEICLQYKISLIVLDGGIVFEEIVPYIS